MAPPRTEYSTAILPTLTPEKAVDIMRERLNTAKLFNDDIAEWLKDRARIEEQYANELDRLAKRAPTAREAALGTFSSIWAEITRSARDMSKSSFEYAKKTRTEIETPIRNFSQKSPQWADVRQLHDGLSGVAHNLTESEEHLAKLKKKASSAKIEGAQISVAESRSQWENQAPYVFGQFEAADESRFVLLKDSLTRLETLEADRGQAVIRSSEHVLNTILSFEPIEEIRSFAAQIVGGNYSGGGGRPVGAHDNSSRASFASSADENNVDGNNHNFNRGLVAGLHRPPRTVTGDDSSSITSNPAAGSGGGSGLKLRSRVGSIFRSKNKQKQISGAGPGGRSKPPVSRHGNNLSERQPQSSVDSARSNGSGGDQIRTSAQPNVAKPPPPPSRKVNGQAASNVTTSSEQQQSSSLPEVGEEEDDQPLYGISSGQQQPFRVNIRKDVITEEKEDADEALSNVSSTLRARPTVSGRSSRGRRDIQSRLFTGIEPSDLESHDSAGNAAVVGQQFFSQLQNFGEQSPTSPTSHQDSSAQPIPPQQFAGQQFTGQQYPGQQIATQQFPAMQQAHFPQQQIPPLQQQQQQFPAQQPSLTGRSVTTSDISGGSSSILPAVGTTVVPAVLPSGTSPISPISPSSDYQTPFAPFKLGRAGSDVQSLRSLQSTSASAPLRHPELPLSEGLVASVAEVINLNMKDGIVSKISIGGEVAFGFNRGSQFSEAPGSIYLKVANKGVDKLVPNPAIVQPSSANNDTFKIDVANNPSVAGSLFGVRQGIVAFKYSFGESTNVASANGYNPLVFVPIWRIENNQSSLMLTYKIAEDFDGEQLEIQDLIIAVPVEGGPATSAQSKPVASFNKDRQRITWRFAETITIKKGVEERLLCRFATEGPAREGVAGIDIRFKVSGNVSTSSPGLQLQYSTKAHEDPFSDEATHDSTVSLPGLSWSPVDSVRTIVTGKYTVYSERNVQTI